MTFLIELMPAGDGTYDVAVAAGAGYQGFRRNGVPLGPATELTIRDEIVTLEQICQAIRNAWTPSEARLLDRRGKIAIGQFLWDAVFGDDATVYWERLTNLGASLRILVPDEYTARLPWNLMGHNGGHCVLRGMMVSLTTKAEVPNAALPPLPTLLIVAPEPKDCDPTQAATHIETIELMLLEVDERYRRGSRLRVVRGWDEFLAVTAGDFQADAVYFYGHGLGDQHWADLVFEENGVGRKVPLSDFVHRMLDASGLVPRKAPRIVYINCCFGDAAGRLGAGLQFHDRVPVVIANRSFANIRAARAQGQLFWKRVLLDAIEPVRAVGEMYSGFLDYDVDGNSVHWMTPVIYRHYARWDAKPMQNPQGRRVEDVGWRFKLDRVQQFSIIQHEIGNSFRARRPRVQSYVWYGQPGQGCETLLHRVAIELQESFPNCKLVEVRPHWPDIPDAMGFRAMLCEAFEVQSLDEIPARLRDEMRGMADLHVLAYVRHQPLVGKQVINPETLKVYFELWDTEIAPLFMQNDYALIGIAFIVKQPEAFARVMAANDPSRLSLRSLRFNLLDELKPIQRKDLVDFLQTHNVPLPETRRDAILNRILEATGGHYEATIGELERVVQGLWDIGELPAPTKPLEDQDFE